MGPGKNDSPFPCCPIYLGISTLPMTTPFNLNAFVERNYGVPAGTYASRVQRNMGSQPILVQEDHEGAVCIPDQAGVPRYWMGTEKRPYVRAKLIECPDGVTRTVPACWRQPRP